MMHTFIENVNYVHIGFSGLINNSAKQHKTIIFFLFLRIVLGFPKAWENLRARCDVKQMDQSSHKKREPQSRPVKEDVKSSPKTAKKKGSLKGQKKSEMTNSVSQAT